MGPGVAERQTTGQVLLPEKTLCRKWELLGSEEIKDMHSITQSVHHKVDSSGHGDEGGPAL